MRRKIIYSILVVFCSHAILYGCASYKPAPMTSLQPEFAPYSETIENVTLACKPLSREECKRFFDRDIIDKGYLMIVSTSLTIITYVLNK